MLPHANLDRADLAEAILRNADMFRAYLRDAFLSRRPGLVRADLSRADLPGARLTRMPNGSENNANCWS